MSTTRRILILIGISVLILLPIVLYLPREAVGPTEPAPAPAPEEEMTETDGELSFSYPPELPTTYMRATDWPPHVTRLSGDLVCVEATTEMGGTREAILQGNRYCITTMSEGAAGSVYTEYRYATEREGEHLALSFTIRSMQCGNYGEPQRSACERERSTFSIDELAARIMQSVRFN